MTDKAPRTEAGTWDELTIAIKAYMQDRGSWDRVERALQERDAFHRQEAEAAASPPSVDALDVEQVTALLRTILREAEAEGSWQFVRATIRSSPLSRLTESSDPECTCRPDTSDEASSCPIHGDTELSDPEGAGSTPFAGVEHQYACRIDCKQGPHGRRCECWCHR